MTRSFLNGLVVSPVCAVLSCSVVSDFMTSWIVACQAPLSMGILQARILESFAMPSSRESSQPKDQTQDFCIAGGFFTVWAPGKLINTGVGSLFFLQGIFLTKELNQSLLHCRQIFYQLSYQGSPVVFPVFFSLSLNFAIRSSWSEPQSAPSLVFADCIQLLHLQLQRI